MSGGQQSREPGIATINTLSFFGVLLGRTASLIASVAIFAYTRSARLLEVGSCYFYGGLLSTKNVRGNRDGFTRRVRERRGRRKPRRELLVVRRNGTSSSDEMVVATPTAWSCVGKIMRGSLS